MPRLRFANLGDGHSWGPVLEGSVLSTAFGMLEHLQFLECIERSEMDGEDAHKAHDLIGRARERSSQLQARRSAGSDVACFTLTPVPLRDLLGH